MYIGFAGAGHGGKAALQSLQEYFEKIEILSDDEEIIRLARESDKLILVDDFLLFTSEIIICAGFMKLVPQNILNKKKVINTHPSLLPRYRGIHSLAWAIINGESTLGFTVHIMNENIDDGPIIWQWKVNNSGQKSAYFLEYFDQCVREELGGIISKYINGELISTPQDLSQATWVSRRYLKDCKIDFTRTNKYLKNFFQALSDPYPLPFFELNGMNYQVTQCSFDFPLYEAEPGKVINIDSYGVYVKTGDSIVCIKELRLSKKTLVPSEVLKIGMKL